MAYCAVTDVLNKAIIKPATDAGWDVTSNSPDVGEFITEAQSVIDGILGKLGYALPFAAVPPVVKEMAKAYARYALLRDLFTGDAPSQAASSSVKANKDRFDALVGELQSGKSSLVDSTGAVLPRAEGNVQTADYPNPNPLADQYPNFPAGPYPDKFNPLSDQEDAP